MTVRIVMVAGEPSGDLLASHLIRALRQHLPDAVFYGIGGPRMEAEGFRSLWPYERLAVHGYVDAIKRYRELSGIRRKLVAHMRGKRPHVFIGVDAPDFNLWIERRCRRMDVPAVHFISPSIWAWRGERIKQIQRSVSHMLCLFPFEPEIYQRAGVPATYVGHPLADTFPLIPNQAEERKRLQLDPDARIVAMLPGSRESEVRNLAPSFLQAAQVLHQRHPDLQFLVPLTTRATHVLFEQVRAQGDFHGLPLKVMFGHSRDAMIAADVVMVASGTATLEAALLKRPMVVSYRVGRWQWKLFKRMAYLPWVSLPNILFQDEVVPELLQDAATPQALADAVDHWLRDEAACARLVQQFTRLHQILRQDTGDKAARAILPLLGRSVK